MKSMFFFFLENMALIIALMFIALKVREISVPKMHKPFPTFWLSSLFFGLLALVIMYKPLLHEGMLVDLREVPLFFISYVGGWKFGLIASILPAFFRFSLGGPTVIQGIILTIFLPVIIGALFHDKKGYNPPITVINIKRLITGFLIFEFIRSVLLTWTTPITLSVTILLFIFAPFAILSMGLMTNDAHRNIISRRELEVFSNQDPMTNLPNIRYFKSNVEGLISSHIPFAIAMFDVDNFKHYNDTNGHPKGDTVLKTIGQILSASVRKEDFFARYGGEEFIICFSYMSNRDEVFKIAERFRMNVEEYVFENQETQPGGNVTISIGISFSAENRSLEQIIQEADKALYQSKRQGKNQITIS